MSERPQDVYSSLVRASIHGPGPEAPSSAPATADAAAAWARTELARAREEHARGEYDNARARLEALLSGGPQPGQALVEDGTVTACAWSLYGRVLYAQNRQSEATAAFRRAVEHFERFLPGNAAANGQLRSDYGVALVQSGEFARAVPELKRALELDYYTHDTLKNLGIALAMQESDDALGYLQQALTLRPEDAETRLTIAVLQGDPRGFIEVGNTQLLAGDASRAGNAFERALELGGDQPELRAEAQAKLGLALVGSGRAEEAVAHLTEATESETWSFFANEYLAEALRTLGRFPEALTAVDRALGRGQDAFSLGTKGQILAAMERPDEAVSWLQRAAEAEPAAEWVYASLLPLLLERGRTEEAEQALRRLTTAVASAWGSEQLGRLLRQRGRLDDALEILERAASLAPANQSLCGELVTVLRAMRRYEDALRALERYQAEVPPEVWARTEVAETLRLMGRNEDALAALDALLDLEPDRAYTLGTKGQILRAQGKVQEARELFERALVSDPELRWVKEELFLTTVEADGTDAALQLVDRLLAEDPGWDRGHARRGALLRGLGRLEEARPGLEQAVQLDPEDTFALNELAECLRGLGRNDEALTFFDRSLAIAPRSDFALGGKAAILLTRGDPVGAVELAGRALENERRNAFAASVKAVALRTLADWDAAIDVLQEALTFNPDHIGLLAELGETFRAMERETEALAVLDHALSLSPDNAECLATRGYTLRTLDRYEEGLRDLRRAVEIDPHNAWAHGALGHVLLESAQVQEALGELSRGQELDPSLTWCVGLHALASFILDDFAVARTSAAQARELNPDDLAWTQCLADSYLAENDAPRAEQLYREIVATGASGVDPDVLARLGWAHRALRAHEAAAQAYQRALSLTGRRIEYIRFDFALALLCAGNVDLARAEYERALAGLAKVPQRRARGILRVALHDLDMAGRVGAVADVGVVRGALQSALETAAGAADQAAPLAAATA